MKKHIMILAVIVCCLSLFGCGDSQEQEPVSEIAVTTSPTPEAAEEPEVDNSEIRIQKQREESIPYQLLGNLESSKEIKSGDGSKHIGYNGYVKANKSDFMALSYKEIQELNAYIEGLGEKENYFTIVFEDGTGIVYAGCSALFPDYGKISGDYEYVITDSYGIISDTGSYFVLLDDNDQPITEDTNPFGVNGIQ